MIFTYLHNLHEFYFVKQKYVVLLNKCIELIQLVFHVEFHDTLFVLMQMCLHLSNVIRYLHQLHVRNLIVEHRRNPEQLNNKMFNTATLILQLFSNCYVRANMFDSRTCVTNQLAEMFHFGHVKCLIDVPKMNFVWLPLQQTICDVFACFYHERPVSHYYVHLKSTRLLL